MDTMTLEQTSQNTHYYYVLKTVCRVSIKRNSLEANHAETKTASEALRSGLMWVINNRIQISNKINRATAIVNGYEARPASNTERPRTTIKVAKTNIGHRVHREDQRGHNAVADT